jgi:HEPN domain
VKKDAKREAIRYWWEKALEALEAARRDLAAEAFSFAINRAYYALFEFTKFDDQYVGEQIKGCEDFLAQIRPLIKTLAENK